MPFLDDVVTALVAANVGVFGVNLFASSAATIPTGDGPYITVVETGGTAPTRKQNQTSAATQRPTAQILCRAKTYAAARAKAWAAYQALDGTFNIVLNSTMYLSITARQEPTDMQLDAANRAQVVFNIDAEKQPS